ncbi:MAG: hypothetical protein ABW186_03910 [Rhodanobacteraceae bacterium]
MAPYPVRLNRFFPLLLLVLELPLILNPGYFAHDELVWLARADVPSWDALQWTAWLDLTPLLYRPLTSNLWLALSHALQTSPHAMHLMIVALGIANAWGLSRVLVAREIPERIAATAAVVFALTPYAIYVAGWVATIGDLLTLAFGLLAARAIQRAVVAPGHPIANLAATTSALLIALALLSKESAIVLPALLLLAPPPGTSHRRILLAITPSALVVAIYLALRLPVLSASAAIAPAYAWSLDHIPARIAEFLLYPFVPPLFEIAPTLSKGAPRIAAAAICIASLLAALATADRRAPVVWLLAYVAALAPVLVLATSYNQYAYLASAVGVAIVAASWRAATRPARATLALLAIVVVVHGCAVMLRFPPIGSIQSSLCADLAAALETSPAPIRIVATDARDAWLPARILEGVASWRGTRFAGRVHFADDATARASDRLLFMNRDGHLHPDASPLTPD